MLDHCALSRYYSKVITLKMPHYCLLEAVGIVLRLIECKSKRVYILYIKHQAKKIYGVKDVHLHAFVKLDEEVNFTPQLLHLGEKKVPPNPLKAVQGPRDGHVETEKDKTVPSIKIGLWIV